MSPEKIAFYVQIGTAIILIYNQLKYVKLNKMNDFVSNCSDIISIVEDQIDFT